MDALQPLASGAKQLNIHADEQQLNALLQYVELLQKWNQAYNLTAIVDTYAIISKHILDSLSVAQYLKGKYIVDVGSGAGLPGIPLAIIFADKQFTLLDSNMKKTRFMQQACIDLRLKNVQVVHQRAEDYQPEKSIDEEFTTLVSRAFAGTDKLLASCDQLLKHLHAKGRIIFMLGKQKQLEALPNRYNVLAIHSVKIPQLEAQRHIALVEKS